MKGTRTLIAGLLALVLAGCAIPRDEGTSQTTVAAAAGDWVMVGGKRVYAPPGALRPGTDPWGGDVVFTPQGAVLLAALHSDNVVGSWAIGRDRSVRALPDVAVGYHPDGVAALGPDLAVVAVEGMLQLQFLRVSATAAPEPVLALTTPFPVQDVRAPDLDGDGLRDLLLMPYQGKQLAILWGEDELVFSTPQTWATDFPTSPKVVDWDGDGRLDLLWTEYLTGAVRLYLNQGGRQFQMRTLQESERGRPRELAVGDVDGDGRPDAVMVLETGQAARILYNRGAEAPQVENVPAPAWGYRGVAVMGDGTLVLGEERRLFLARKQEGQWHFRRLAAGSLPSPLRLTDLDRDGHEDVVIYHPAHSGVLLHFGPLWDKGHDVSDLTKGE